MVNISRFIIIILFFLLYNCGLINSKSDQVSINKMLMDEIRKTYSADVSFQTINKDLVEKQYMKILDQQHVQVGYGFITTAKACTVNGCLIHREDYKGQFEEFTFITLYNLDDEILKIKILDYPSDYGYEITSKNWLKQFNQTNGHNLTIDKDIDGISGATISVNSLINELENQYELTKSNGLKE